MTTAATAPKMTGPQYRDSFRYLDDLPALVVGISVYEREFRHDAEPKPYTFKPGIPARRIVHQTGGLACHQHYIHGLVLTPRNGVRLRMIEAERKWLGTNCGGFHVDLDEVLEYRDWLRVALPGADCNDSYRDFEEGIYPIDYSPKLLKALAADELPAGLDELVAWEKGLEWIGCMDRWRMFILGANSD